MEITIKTLDQLREQRVTVEVAPGQTAIVEVDGARLYTAAEVGHYQASEAELVSAPLRMRVRDLEAALEIARSRAHAFDLDRKSERDRADRLNERNAELAAEVARLTKGHVCVDRCRPNAHVASLGLELARRPSELKCCEEYGEPARVAVCGPACHEAHTYVPPCEQPAEMAQILAARDRLLATVSAERETERTRADQNRAWAERAESRVAALGLELADARRAIDILSSQLGRVSGAVHSPDLQASMRTTWETKTARAMKEAIQTVRDALGSPSLPSPPKTATSQA